MAQQWFLDLDGVRSGPYQTPEVLGLIAEGEVLPHHRISSSLKDQPWLTVLEWRLEQAKQGGPQSEQKSYIPQGEPSPKKPAPKPYDIRWNDPQGPVPASTPPPSNEVGAVDLNPDAGADEIEEVIQVLKENALPAEPVPEPEPAPVNLEVEPPPVPVAPPTIRLEPIQAEEPKSEATPEPRSAGSAKRDPMAEMYDLLQNSKQKREAKERARESSAHASSHGHSPSPSHERGPKVAAGNSSQSSWVKTVVIGLLITAAGFILGQLVQQNSAPPPAATTAEKNLTAPAKAPEPRTEVVDRSTDKITIRAKVDKPAPSPVATHTSPAPASAHAGQHSLNDKDVQELKDLKRELQELKALKDELKANPLPNSDDSADVPMDDNYLEGGAFEGTGGAAYAPDPTKPGIPPPNYPNVAPSGQAPVNY